MNREQSEAKIEELEEQLLDAQDELKARPTNTIEVEVIREITIENSGQSETLGAIALALSKAQSEFKAVYKGKEGYGYSYADIASILAYAQPIYTVHELSIIQLIVSKVIGKTMFAGVKTVLAHSSGEWISSESYIPIAKTKSNSLVQQKGSATTYIRRYQLQSILGLATTDTDGSDK